MKWFLALLDLGLIMVLSEEGPVEAGLFRDLHPSRDIPIFVYWFSAERDIMAGWRLSNWREVRFYTAFSS